MKKSLEEIKKEYDRILSENNIALENMRFASLLDEIDILLEDAKSLCSNICYPDDSYIFRDASDKIKMRIENYIDDYNYNRNKYILNVLMDIEEALKKNKKNNSLLKLISFNSDKKDNDNYKKNINNNIKVLEGCKKAKRMTVLFKAFLNVIARIDWYERNVDSNFLKKYNMTLQSYEEDFKKAFDNSNLDEMEILIKNINEKIFLEFKKYLKLNKCNKFYFIGHSINNNKKAKNYTSCSLFTDECMDTFNNKYGYIVDDNIQYGDFKDNGLIASSGYDMDTINNANNKDDLFTGGEIPLIQFPQKMVYECADRKNKNPNFNIYNEVVMHNPKFKKIFCFTNGMLSYDSNYVLAIKLHKGTGLPIEFYDIMRLSCHEQNINSIRLDIIKRLALELNINSNLISKMNLYLFDDFFQKFDKLKNGKYTEKDIRYLFLGEYYKIIISRINKNKLENQEEVLRLEYHK